MSGLDGPEIVILGPDPAELGPRISNAGADGDGGSATKWPQLTHTANLFVDGKEGGKVRIGAPPGGEDAEEPQVVHVRADGVILNTGHAGNPVGRIHPVKLGVGSVRVSGLANGTHDAPDVLAVAGGCLLYTSPSPRD